MFLQRSNKVATSKLISPKLESMSEPSINTSILPLPADAIAKIKSSTVITSLESAILGLFENALDARSTNVEINYDVRRGCCTVEDDGLGIPPSEFRDTGGLGRMYHTSKHIGPPTSELHGGSGTFLASLGALSLVTITSHHHEYYSHNTLVLHRSKPIVRLTPAPAQQEIRGSAHGTRVIVRDLFGDMPVRVKHRAVAADEPTEHGRRLHALKKHIVALLLPWDGPVNVKVSDCEDSRRTFVISSQPASSEASSDNSTVVGRRIPVAEPSKVINVLEQAGYMTHADRSNWIPASASTFDISVEGIISLIPAPSKTAQFISIGIVPFSGESGYHELYETVNNVFRRSNFGQVEDVSDLDDTEMERRKHDRRYKSDGPTVRKRRGGTKGVDRWPKFYFHITVKRNEPRHARDVHAPVKSMVDVLEALAMQWLEANHFRQIKRERKNLVTGDVSNASLDTHESDSSSAATSTSKNGLWSTKRLANAARPSPQASVSSDAERDGGQALTTSSQQDSGQSSQSAQFKEWSRIKSSRPTFMDNMWKGSSPLSRPASAEAADTKPSIIKVQPLAARELNTIPSLTLSKSWNKKASTSNNDDSAKEQETEGTLSDKIVDWVDQSSKQRYRINTRTGIVLPERQRPASVDTMPTRQAATINTGHSAWGRPLNLQRRQTAPIDRTASPWLSELLNAWENPVFVNQKEQPIPATALDGPGRESGEGEHQCSDRNITESFLQSGKVTTSQLSKHALLHAEVISQVDQKFILVKMPSNDKHTNDETTTDGQLLVLVDQHAASERCILEELLAQLCLPAKAKGRPPIKSKLGHESRIETTDLDKPLHFQVSKNEASMLKGNAAHFARWGILYNLKDDQDVMTSDKGSSSTLTILTLPPAIAERCKLEPKLVIELLRAEVYATADAPLSWSLPCSTRHAAAVGPGSDSAAVVAETDKDRDPHPAWLGQMASCPEGMVKLINSRACRSAIMFNDVLSVVQCRALVRGLAGTVFPFMCAHGRVSMVPLVDLGPESNVVVVGGGGTGADDYSDADMDGLFGHAEGYSRQEEDDAGFVAKYLKWKLKR